MFVKSLYDVEKAYESIGYVKRLSDGLIKIGPINVIGLDGILAWLPIPIVGSIYSVGASLFILGNAFRARTSPIAFVQGLILLLMDLGVSGVKEIVQLIPPLIPFGAIPDTLFQGHLYAAHIVQKDIEKTWYIEASAREAYQSGQHKANLATLKATKGKSRLVYLLP
jgi:hypothetical protein